MSEFTDALDDAIEAAETQRMHDELMWGIGVAPEDRQPGIMATAASNPGPVSIDEIRSMIDRQRILPSPPKRIEISDEALAALRGLLTEPVSSVLVTPNPMLGGVPLVRSLSIPPGWAKVVPVEGEPRWIRVSS